MSPCNDIVEKVYTSPELNRLIARIQPPEIRDDLRQEIAVALLSKPCTNLQWLYHEKKLMYYAIRICTNMAMSNTSAFHREHRKNDWKKAADYLRSLVPEPMTVSFVAGKPVEYAAAAAEILHAKTVKSKEEHHEAVIFQTYVELGSNRKVAEYFGIPLNHVCNVVKKVKHELQCLRQQ